ncbi:hypothetical protein SSX86_023319 [Deinandra increscens subsp. villosa]|uniref:Uncharacterized protein n=1 Tax=Deinandra increscens subsp. villosa TaxID=3103831 RepID=A0AAP0CQT6_9ASTR
MSRCFPFPPPGYEKKPTTDEPDLLKKEKRKEKKHKKDKKDKEKKDGKEKREKDRSEGKHREKKDKNRDKKKDKDKSKTIIPAEKNIYGQFEEHNGEVHQHNNEVIKEKIGSIGDKKPLIQFPHQNGDLFRNNNRVGDTENSKFVQELDRRIRDEEKGMGSHQFVVDGRKNSVNKVEIPKTDGRQVVANVASFGGDVPVSRTNGTPPLLDNRRTEKMKEKGSDGRQVVMDVMGFDGNVVVPNRINGVIPRPLDNKRVEKVQEKGSDDKRKNKDRDKQKEGKDKEARKEKKMEKSKEKSEEKKAKKDKNKHITKSGSADGANNLSTYPLENSFQGVVSEGNLKKRKAMETNGVSHENEPRPNKMARSVSNISPENGRKLDFLQNPGPSLLDKQGTSHVASLNSLNGGSKGGQRVNGMMTSQPVSISAKKPPIPALNHVPSKPYPIKSPPVITNHVATQSPPTTKPQPNVIAAQQPTSKPPPSTPYPIPSHHQLPPLSSPPQPPTTLGKQPMSQPKPPPAVNKVAPSPQLAIPKKKPPHPDTKYLTQILSVPKLEPWCGSDDQEWLFSRKAGPTSKKPPIKEPEVQVWSEAKHIESVDVCALPYVIPY